ncbi:hypothetical protein CAI21_16910 [Alkalilimnicola ehrlichii]|uniref:Uncharacterized protein n=1 Tax=Alkalilimnicola ehrlichii TaxID=351052 RepID=A0A3E0WKE7_9GAMM|nr:hypothetical protein [Alkalilimnicola ehrlichii]RFA26371.1 hypothetical protein CAI21_16910 [Alkalilimnicola ehrlichii]RFA33434.1 hypothetical protein CAL65_17395 [Alkalilimnicola ehrlichii]
MKVNDCPSVNVMLYRSICGYVLVLLLLSAGSSARGEAITLESSDAGRRDDSAYVLDAITVTARRVLEPLHHVPASVAVIEPDADKNGAIDAATEAARKAPNLALSDTGPGADSD